MAESLPPVSSPLKHNHNTKNKHIVHSSFVSIVELQWLEYITKTRLFKYIKNFTTKKMKIFR